MKYRNRKLSWERFSSSPAVVVAILLLFVFLGKTAWNMRQKAVVSKEHLAQAEASLENIKDRRDILEKNVQYLSTDEGIEAEIRSKFRAVSPGEKVVVIIDGGVSATDTATTTTVSKPWWRKLLGI